MNSQMSKLECLEIAEVHKSEKYNGWRNSISWLKYQIMLNPEKQYAPQKTAQLKLHQAICELILIRNTNRESGYMRHLPYSQL